MNTRQIIVAAVVLVIAVTPTLLDAIRAWKTASSVVLRDIFSAAREIRAAPISPHCFYGLIALK